MHISRHPAATMLDCLCRLFALCVYLYWVRKKMYVRGFTPSSALPLFVCLLINATLLSDNHEMRQWIVTFSISSFSKILQRLKNICVCFFKLKRQNKSLPAAKREPIDRAVKVATACSVLTTLKLPIDKFFLLARLERPIKFLLTLSAVRCMLRRANNKLHLTI